jgi:cell division septum initiation protein DivIVA
VAGPDIEQVQELLELFQNRLAAHAAEAKELAEVAGNLRTMLERAQAEIQAQQAAEPARPTASRSWWRW